MKSLTLRKCPKLTDEAFTRCAQLTRLTSLDICYISKHVSGVLLGSFTLCPIENLSMDGIVRTYIVNINCRIRYNKAGWLF